MLLALYIVNIESLHSVQLHYDYIQENKEVPSSTGRTDMNYLNLESIRLIYLCFKNSISLNSVFYCH